MGKRQKLLFILLAAICLCTGCEYCYNNYTRTEYAYEDVQAEITDIEKSHWFAGCHHYRVTVEVYYSKYDINDIIEYQGGDVYYNDNDIWYREVGDYITCTLITVTKNGEVQYRMLDY